MERFFFFSGVELGWCGARFRRPVQLWSARDETEMQIILNGVQKKRKEMREREREKRDQTKHKGWKIYRECSFVLFF